MSNSNTPRCAKTISDWIDSETQIPQQANQQNASEEEHNVIADQLVVHALLQECAAYEVSKDEQKIQNVMESIDNLETRPASRSHLHSRLAVASTLVALSACILFALNLFGPETATAESTLEQLIESASQSVDCEYRIHVLEEYSELPPPRKEPLKNRPLQSKRKSVTFIDDVDGATLYVGGINRYVFIRKLSDGSQRISGCDGRESWAFRNDSPIHVSQDLIRFRGGLPGNQQDLGFTDIHAQLLQLRKGYDIELSKNSTGEFHRLIAQRLSNEVRGPKQVEIEFDPREGTILEMVLDGLPRGRSGPKSVEFLLISQEAVGPEFYSHDSHHAPGRPIKDLEKLDD